MTHMYETFVVGNSEVEIMSSPLSSVADVAAQTKQLDSMDEMTDSSTGAATSNPFIGSTNDTVASPLLLPTTDDILKILPGTPADIAIQAQAHVRVTKAKKLARYLHVQTVGRVVRHGLLLLPSSGNRKGKPPRIPPNVLSEMDTELLVLDATSPRQQYQQDHSQQQQVFESCRKDDHLDEEASWDGLSQDSRPIIGGENDRGDNKTEGNFNDESFEETDLVSVDDTNGASDSGVVKSKVLMASIPAEEGSQINQQDSTIPLPPPPSESPIVSTTLTRSASSKLSPLKWPSVLSPHNSPKNTIRKIPTFHTDTAQERRLRRRKERKEKRLAKKNSRKSYVKGKVIDREHELYTLSIAMMLGLRTSIGVTHAQLIQQKQQQSSSSTETTTWLNPEQFMQVEKYQFKPSGSSQTPPHQLSHTFKVKGYSPMVFAYIRRLFGINESKFLLSVCGQASYIEFISNAKSGQFFFYSNDGKYMIKTMTNAESKFLRRILPHYFQHCVENPNTLITKFLGMYRVKLYHLQRNVKFIIMNSVFDTDNVLQSFFDLKGSSLGRDAKPGQSVKKDNDVRRGFPDSIFSLHSPVRDRMRNQLIQDLEFLKRMKIMDYSMLIGVHHIPCQQPPPTPHEDIHQGSNDAQSIVTGLNFRDQTSRVLQRSQVDHDRLKLDTVPIPLDDAPLSVVHDGRLPSDIVDPGIKLVSGEEISPTTINHRVSKGQRLPMSSTQMTRPSSSGRDSSPLEVTTEKLGPHATVMRQSSKTLSVEVGADRLYCESPDESFYSATSNQDEAKLASMISPNQKINPGINANHSDFANISENQHNDENLIRTVLGAQSYESYSTLDEYSSDTDDDENSLLQVENEFDTNLRVGNTTKTCNHGSTEQMKNDSHLLKERISEELFWPFDYLYDFKGRRRLKPSSDPILPSFAPNDVSRDSRSGTSYSIHDLKDKSKLPWITEISHRCNTCLCLNDFDKSDAHSIGKSSTHAFTPPLSNRKDGGFLMDTTGFNVPLKLSLGPASQYYNGKIFYMGIIDVLQQFNIRKRLEARFRKIKGGGWEGASCVHPFLYADRFLHFFDEYTRTREPSSNERS